MAIGHTTDVGAFSGSGSFYGTFDQTGNVYEWNDLDGTAWYLRGIRGSGWDSYEDQLSSATNDWFEPEFEDYGLGFRLASPV